MRTREATYFTQVGDSRGYLYSRGELRQLMRDQTAAQALIDQGLMAPQRRERSPFHCEQLAKDLLPLALVRGGADNITIIAGRAPLRRG